jgi:hypothetical protein
MHRQTYFIKRFLMKSLLLLLYMNDLKQKSVIVFYYYITIIIVTINMKETHSFTQIFFILFSLLLMLFC